MIGKISNVIQKAKDGITNAILLGKIENGELVIWWRYGFKVIAKRIIALFTRAKLGVATGISFVFGRSSKIKIRSGAEHAPAADVLTDSEIQTDIDSKAEAVPAADANADRAIRVGLRAWFKAYKIGELHFRKILNMEREANALSVLGVAAAGIRKIFGSVKSAAVWSMGAIAKAKRITGTNLTAKADQAQAVSGQAERIVQLRTGAEVEHAQPKEIKTSRAFYTVLRAWFDANLIGEMHFRKQMHTGHRVGLISVFKSVAVGIRKMFNTIRATVTHAESVLARVGRSFATSTTAEGETASAEVVQAERAIQLSPSVVPDTAPVESIGAKIISISPYLASMSVGERWHWAEGSNLTILRTKNARQDGAILYLDDAAGAYWLDPVQTGTNLHIRQAYRTLQKDSVLHIDGSVGSLWSEPAQDGANLTIKQAYSATQSGDNLEVS